MKVKLNSENENENEIITHEVDTPTTTLRKIVSCPSGCFLLKYKCISSSNQISKHMDLKQQLRKVENYISFKLARSK